VREGTAVAIGAFAGVERANKLAQEIKEGGGRAIVVVGDLASREDTDRIVDQAVSAFDGLDILVHNAGIDITQPGPVGETTDEFWDRVLAIHLTAGFRLTKRALPALLKGRGPAVLFIGSVAGVVAWEGNGRITWRRQGFITSPSALPLITRKQVCERVASHPV
jgi:NAD(P)-dependent dehydrogenase (short-subunit alcohol dehydrogenase family)